MENYINSAESKALNNHFNFILLSKIFFYVCKYFCLHVYMCPVPEETRRPCGSSGTKVTDGCELRCCCWEQKPSPL